MSTKDNAQDPLIRYTNAYQNYSLATIAWLSQNKTAGAYVIPQVISGASITNLRKTGINGDWKAFVVLHDFWGGSAPSPVGEQALTLLHELLHVHYNVDQHGLIGGRLGIGSSATSATIDNWLRGGCR